MGFEIWKSVKTSHIVLMVAGFLAVGAAIAGFGPSWFSAALVVIAIALLGSAAVLMDRHRDSQ